MTSASEQTSFGIGSKPRTEVLSVRIRLRRKVRCSRFRRSRMCSVLGWLACLWEGLFLSRKFILKGIHCACAIRCKTNPSFFSRYGDGFLVGVRSGSDKDTVARFNDFFSSALAKLKLERTQSEREQEHLCYRRTFFFVLCHGQYNTYFWESIIYILHNNIIG